MFQFLDSPDILRPFLFAVPTPDLGDIELLMDIASPSSRVSIGIPTYNAERYIEHTLQTVLQQTYSDFVVFITDNASTDKTQEICQQYASQDKRVHYIRNSQNVGAAGNYHKCFEPAKSEFFRWQNADDPIEPQLLELCVKALDENPAAVLAYGKSKIIDENGNFLEDYDDNLELSSDVPSIRFQQCLERIGLQNVMYGLIRRKDLAHTALLGNYLAADLNLIGELSLYGHFAEIPQHLFNRRMHPDASSWDRKDAERQKNFWDPSKRKLILQTWRSIFEYYKAAIRAPIPINEKRKVCYYISKRAYWRKENMWNELVDLFRYGIPRRSK